MGNCLVTKLKGTVDNDNLPLFGYFEVKVIGFGSNSGLTLYIGAEEQLEIILRDFTINGLDHITVAAGGMFSSDNIGNWVKTGNNPTLLIPKYAHYHTLGLPGGEYNTDDFVYLKCARGFTLGGIEIPNVIYGNLANMLKMFEGTTEAPTGIYFGMNVNQNNPSFEGCDISSLFSRKVKSIRLHLVKGVIGNMDNVGKSADVLTAFVAPDDKRLTLSIENMVAIARTNGFTTGTMTFNYLGYITATFNGAELDNSVSTDTITWDATTITVRGVTIEA